MYKKYKDIEKRRLYLKEYRKKWYKKNKEYRKKWYKKNKEKMKKYQKEWREKNRKKLKIYYREQYRKNHEKINKQKRERRKKNSIWRIERECENCRKAFIPTSYKQIYCNEECRPDIQHRYIARKHKEIKCYFCEETRFKMLDVHHIDENSKNNDPNNLIFLCPNHHREVHLGYRTITLEDCQ